MRRHLTSGLAFLAVLVAPSAAGAAWSSPGSGGQWARAISLSGGSTPTASVSNRSVTVSWSATTLPGGAPVAGYVVRRYSTGGTLQSIGSACSGTVSSTSCTEAGVPGGTWRYTVQPKQGNWTGAEGSQSSSVTVAAPSLTLSPTTVSSLPATLTGSVAAYVPGQTITFRLDNPSTGTVLSATVTPSTIPAGGGASVSVTLPAGTAPGAHQVYAVGSAGDTASAPVSVTTTILTPAWDLRDGSTGALTDVSATHAFSGDGRTFATTNWSNAFSTSRWIDYDLNASLQPGLAVSGASFNYRLAATNAGDTACFYFELRRASTGIPLPGGTHWSTTTPAGCVTGTTLTTVPVSIPELNTTDLANDARIRVYTRMSTNNRATTIDMATVTGSVGSMPFTLYGTSYNDAADGSAALFPWSLAVTDGTAYTSATDWATTFNTARYLRVTFPAYVPATATVTSATARFSHRPVSSADTSCWYAQTYSGGSPLVTHGSSTTPVSCTTGTAYAVGTLTLNEVTTPAIANDLTIRIYERVTGSNNTRTTQHDLADMSVTYVP